MSKFKSKKAQNRYADTDSVFIEYLDFARRKQELAAQKAAFIADEAYVPSYTYGELIHLYDTPEPKTDKNGNPLPLEGDEFVFADKKRETEKAILELEANRASGKLSKEMYNLSADTHESYLKKMILAESAKRLQAPGSSSDRELAEQEFSMLNKELFGEIDQTTFDSMLTTEQARVASFEPTTDAGTRVKEQLENYFSSKEFSVEEQPIIDEEAFAELQEAVRARFGNILNVVPETDNETKYNACQCAEIITNALKACDLYEKGWRGVVDSEVSIPSTEVDKKIVKLPEDTLRTADELRRLIVHEVGVHARRGQNGEDTGVHALKFGTANYADVEEGEGVLLECVVAGTLDNPSLDRARDRYIVAGLALGSDGTPRDARQTYELAWRMFAVRMSKNGQMTEDVIARAKDMAFTHVDNAFRGTAQTMPGVIYRKLKMYYEGLQKNGQYFINHKGDIAAALEVSLIGKCDHTDEAEHGEMEQVNACIKQAA